MAHSLSAHRSSDAVIAPDRWVGVGRSGESDARRAGSEAAVDALCGRTAKLLVVFCSDAYDLEALLAEINERSGGVALVGCSTAGEISTGGPTDSGVVVVALGGEGFSVRTAVAERASTRLREAGAEVAGIVADVEGRGHRALLLLTDGLAGDQQEIVRGAYGVLGAETPLVGGCAGDDLKVGSPGTELEFAL